MTVFFMNLLDVFVICAIAVWLSPSAVTTLFQVLQYLKPN